MTEFTVSHQERDGVRVIEQQAASLDNQLPETGSRVPVGMEKVLFAAASDQHFMEELFEDREAAVEARGFRLRDSEMAMLRMIPDEHLRSAINGLDTSDRNLERRNFMRAVAATAVTVAAADALSGCSDDSDKDSGPSPKDSGPPDQRPPDQGGNTVDSSTLDLGPAPVGIRPGDAKMATGIRPG